MSAPDAGPIRLSREQLYQEVWSTPIRQLAEKFGISDVGLAKVCKRMRIPKPSRGYWRRKETGFPVRRSPLPKKKEGDQEEVIFFAGPEMRMPRRLKASKIPPEIFVSFGQPHPLVDLLAKSLRTAQTDDSGILKIPSTAPIPVHVRRSNLGKALRVMDALFKAWLKKGHEIRIDEEHESPAVLASGAIEIGITLREEKGDRLCVELTGKRDSRRRIFRRRLREKTHISLEAWIGRVLGVALDYLERRKKVILDLERRQRELDQWKTECEIRARKHEEAVRLWQEERHRSESLIAGISEWQRARDAAEFIAACRSMMIERGESPDRVDQWVTWAEAKTGAPSRKLVGLVERTVESTRLPQADTDTAA